MRDWIGGHTFIRKEDVLAYFRNIAAQYPNGCQRLRELRHVHLRPDDASTSPEDTGHSNPATQDFYGPDNRHWVWMYIADRNEWFFVDKDRNPSTYFQVYQYNTDINTTFDDGYGAAYSLQANIKYMIDAYDLFGGSTQAQ